MRDTYITANDKAGSWLCLLFE